MNNSIQPMNNNLDYNYTTNSNSYYQTPTNPNFLPQYPVRSLHHLIPQPPQPQYHFIPQPQQQYLLQNQFINPNFLHQDHLHHSGYVQDSYFNPNNVGDKIYYGEYEYSNPNFTSLSHDMPEIVPNYHLSSILESHFLYPNSVEECFSSALEECESQSESNPLITNEPWEGPNPNLTPAILVTPYNLIGNDTEVDFEHKSMLHENMIKPAINLCTNKVHQSFDNSQLRKALSGKSIQSVPVLPTKNINFHLKEIKDELRRSFIQNKSSEKLYFSKGQPASCFPNLLLLEKTEETPLLKPFKIKICHPDIDASSVDEITDSIEFNLFCANDIDLLRISKSACKILLKPQTLIVKFGENNVGNTLDFDDMNSITHQAEFDIYNLMKFHVNFNVKNYKHHHTFSVLMDQSQKYNNCRTKFSPMRKEDLMIKLFNKLSSFYHQSRIEPLQNKKVTPMPSVEGWVVCTGNSVVREMKRRKLNNKMETPTLAASSDIPSPLVESINVSKLQKLNVSDFY